MVISTVLGLAPTAVVLFSTALADLVIWNNGASLVAKWVHPSVRIRVTDVRP